MDYKYWNEYYKKNIAPNEPSKFAKDILKYLDSGKKLIELGCGNGRDAMFLANNNISVVAIDQSESSINNLKQSVSNNNIEFVVDDFIKTKLLKRESFDYIYSRFTLHSISEEQEEKLLKRVYEGLKKDGLFLVEARSIKDDIFGLGEKIARNTYVYNNHSRRFIVLDELVKKLTSYGFKIEFVNESNNYAAYKDQNPIVIRVIAKK
ncbi:class I SAM-dependent methyltransferase [Romboutsia timonensis]|uniref:class I SAM-dependent methyltransferase n=1 Tax=Romboutsia timonensis TaxID=1776391 RepID=UPI0008D99B80|nr:class I SAM-dependent methyltransferase [Romboutsia timonensis]